SLSDVQSPPLETLASAEEEGMVEAEGTGMGRRFNPKLGLALVVTAIFCGLATFVLLTGLSPITPTPNVISILMGVNGVLVLSMIGMIGWQLAAVWRARRRRLAGSRLHIRIVTLFSIIAAVPALVVALFATVTLNRGLDSWFSERTQSIVDEAQLVAQAYLTEHDAVLREALSTIAFNIGRQTELLNTDKQAFTRRLANEVAFRRLAAAYVINSQKRKVEASVTSTGGITFTPPPNKMFETARQGKGIVISP
ncbi:unnamed protein product, partial [Discosporangium mesarthrocarpum]